LFAIIFRIFCLRRYKECLRDPSRINVNLSGVYVSAASVTYPPETLTFTQKSVRRTNHSAVNCLTSRLVSNNFGIASLAADLLWHD